MLQRSWRSWIVSTVFQPEAYSYIHSYIQALLLGGNLQPVDQKMVYRIWSSIPQDWWPLVTMPVRSCGSLLHPSVGPFRSLLTIHKLILEIQTREDPFYLDISNGNQGPPFLQAKRFPYLDTWGTLKPYPSHTWLSPLQEPFTTLLPEHVFNCALFLWLGQSLRKSTRIHVP